MIENLEGVKWIIAKCPDDLEANNWWIKIGFKKISQSESRTGRIINTYWKVINNEV